MTFIFPAKRGTLRPKLAFVDLVQDVLVAVASRGMRSILTALGTLIGIAVLVTTLGLAASASSRILTRFDELAATQVILQPKGDEQTETLSPLSFDAASHVRSIKGVVAATTFTSLKEQDIAVHGVETLDPRALPGNGVEVFSSSHLLPSAMHAEIDGRYFDSFHDDRGESVAVVGAEAARRLNVTQLSEMPTIFLNERPITVIGIITSTSRNAEILGGVVISDGLAKRLFGLEQPGQVVIETVIGAAETVANQAPLAVDPFHPEAYETLFAPTPRFTRDQIASDSQSLMLVLAVVSLAIGGLGIANVTLVSVMERRAEIGLRRALGACRRHIVAQFLLEGTVLGLFGAIAGSSMGVLLTVVVARTRDWPPTMEPSLPFVSVIGGTMVGLLASLYPAIRAGSIEPVEALRAST